MKELFIAAIVLLPFMPTHLWSKELNQKNPIIRGVLKKGSNDKSLDNYGYNISMSKEDVPNQLFLFRAASISTTPVAMGSALRPKVIYFERRNQKLYMFESQQGLMASNSVDAKILLAEFPILSETNKELVIDFNVGMNHLFALSSMYTSDSQEEEPQVVDIDNSYLNKVELRGNFLFIDQFVRVKNETHRFKYSLSSYTINKEYTPKKSSLLKKVGFFENHPIQNLAATDRDDSKLIYILRFNPDKKITYYLSSNIPQDFKAAVTEGVLYWNKAFGKEYLEVKDLPKNISIHEPGYNIVQWIDWDSAGYAYADIEADPLTGESIQSHVYMTSTFGTTSKDSISRVLEQLQKGEHSNENMPKLGLKGFEFGQLCQNKLSPSQIKDVGNVLSEVSELTPEEKAKILNRLSKDYVREVVAHEVGHTLGLRHNFAGSIGANFEESRWDEIWKDYLLHNKVDKDMIMSSSVMDYTPLLISAISGHIINESPKALAYDQAAISWGYSDLALDKLDVPTFCTDREESKFLDCKVWDKFKNPILGRIKDMNESFASFPYILAKRFYSLWDEDNKDEETLKTFTAMSPEERMEKLNAIKFDPEKEGKWLVSSVKDALEMASSEGEFIALKNNYPFVSSFNNKEYQKETNEFKKKSIEKMGGISSNFIFDFIPGKDSPSKTFITIKGAFFDYMSNFGKDVLTEEEVQFIGERMIQYFELLEREFLLQYSTELSKITFAFKADFLEDFFQFIDSVVFSKTTTPLFPLDPMLSLNTPRFQYVNGDQDLRANFIKLSQTNFYPHIPSFERKSATKREVLFKTFMEEHNLVKGDKEYDQLEDQAFDWLFLEAKRFLPLAPKNQPPVIFDYL